MRVNEKIQSVEFNDAYPNYQVNSAQGKARLCYHHPMMVQNYRESFHRLCFAS